MTDLPKLMSIRASDLRAPMIVARMMTRARVAKAFAPGEMATFRRQLVEALVADNATINNAHA